MEANQPRVRFWPDRIDQREPISVRRIVWLLGRQRRTDGGLVQAHLWCQPVLQLNWQHSLHGALAGHRDRSNVQRRGSRDRKLTHSYQRINGGLAFSGIGTNTLRWTLQNSISTARVLSQLQASGANAVKDLAGNELGLGTNFSQNFNILYGDINADGLVNSADMVAARNVVLVSGYNVFADLNGDGVVDAIDIAIARARLGAALPPG